MRFVEAFAGLYYSENVSGLRSTAGGQFEKSIKEAMERLQYKVTIGMLNAADFGVPQIRQRLMFVSVCTGEALPLLINFAWRFCRQIQNSRADAISDLPERPAARPALNIPGRQ